METVKTIKTTIKKWPARSAAVLTVVLIAVIILGQFVFAAGANAIRTVHRIEAGDSTYCFSVEKNVVISESELAEMGDDEELTAQILERAGLFIQESSCRSDEHPAITMEEWLKDGNTLSLSEEDLALIRQAKPVEGRPVKLHLDVFFTLQADEDKAKEEAEKQAETADPEDPSGKTDPADPGEPSDPAEPSEPAEPSDPAEPSEPADPREPSEPGEPTDPAGLTDPADPGEPSDSAEPSDPAEPADPSEPAEPSDPAEPADPSEPAEPSDPAEPADPSEPAEPEEPEQPFERPVYSTYKLTSPELLFVVIAYDSDAAVPEDECEEPEVPEMPEMPELPEIPEISIPEVPQDILPEYRKIEMKDKSGTPLPPVLEDGEPVELIWIEPQKGIDADTARSWVEKYPGGMAGLGGTIAALGAAICGIAYAVNKRKNRDE